MWYQTYLNMWSIFGVKLNYIVIFEKSCNSSTLLMELFMICGQLHCTSNSLIPLGGESFWSPNLMLFLSRREPECLGKPSKDRYGTSKPYLHTANFQAALVEGKCIEHETDTPCHGNNANTWNSTYRCYTPVHLVESVGNCGLCDSMRWTGV